MKNKYISLFLNLLIVIFEIIAINIIYKNNNRIPLEFYTVDSNILGQISSFSYVICVLVKKHMPRIIQLFKYISTMCLTITFLVVIFVLAPMYGFNYKVLLFKDSMLYTHLLCPTISIISFIFFDEVDKIKSKDISIGMSFTLLYSIIIVILNVLRYIEGPYPFLLVYKQPIYMSIFWYIVIICFSYLIGLELNKLNLKYRRKYDEK